MQLDVLDALTEKLCEAIDSGAMQASSKALSAITLEELLESHDLCQLPLSPVQRALARAADGQTITHLSWEQLAKHFGVSAPLDLSEPPTLEFSERPRVVTVRAGVRSGKSLIGAIGSLLKSALTARFRRPPNENEVAAADGLVGVRPGELVRCLIVAPMLKASRQPLYHLIGSIMASERLRGVVVGAPGAESLKIRREDGAIVAVELVAASPGGLNLRSTWLAGILFDEADFHDADDAAVNLKENVRAVRPRMLEGGQIWIVSSPYADEGHYNELFNEAWGKPGRALSFHSPSLDMNPTLDRVEIEAERARDPENAAREFDAVPLASSSKRFLPESAILAACVGSIHGEQPNGRPHWAGGDLAFSRNSSALALACVVGGRIQVSLVRELIPQPKAPPLKPSEVIGEFADECLRYDCFVLRADRYSSPSVLEELPKHINFEGRTVVWQPFDPSATNQTQVAIEFRRLLVEGKIVLPNDPNLIRQLKDVREGKGQGGLKVLMTKRGASHGDIVMAVMLAVTQIPKYELEHAGDASRVSGAVESSGGRFGMRTSGGRRMV